MLEERKRLILETIIKENINTGQPVSSAAVVEKYPLQCSSATVRNEMAVLESDGWIYQPHTSAGRLPTEKAWRWYATVPPPVPPLQPERVDPVDALSIKHAAKALAQASNGAVFWAMHRHNLFYTGISNLLSQPELSQPGLIYNVSAIIDGLDELIAEKFMAWPQVPTVLIGRDCPFGGFLSSVSAKYRYGGQIGLFGIIGPVRQDYPSNLFLIDYLYQQLNYERAENN